MTTYGTGHHHPVVCLRLYYMVVIILIVSIHRTLRWGLGGILTVQGIK